MGRMFARIAAVSIIATTGLFAACAWAEDAPAGNVDNGKRIFIADGCFMCHGRVGQGGAFNYPAPALAQVEMPVESFQAFLREPPNDMPAYSTAVLGRYSCLPALATGAQASQRHPTVEPT